MESLRLPNSFPNNSSLSEGHSLMGMKTTNNHLGQAQPPPPANRMPDPSNNLSLLNQQHVAQPSSMGGGGSRLFFTTQLESRDDLDEKHERCYSLVMGYLVGKSEKEAIDSLTVLVGKDSRAHEDVCLGLVILILTNPSSNEGELSAHRCFRDLTLICRDGLGSVLSHLTHLILEKYLKLLPHVKGQLLWLIKEMVRASVSGMDSIVWNLMRQIAGGDVSRGNLWLADSLLDLFIEYRPWLDKFPFLVASVVYTYLRLMEDHVSPQLEKLREKEAKFVVGLIRDRFTDAMTIGRDFVRILQNLARLPEIGELWRDLLNHPRSLSPTFTGLAQLMETRTSRRFLQCRITPEMEKKLFFLTSQVKFGSHKRYQEWFQRQYLSTQESQSLRCDLIRFIVGVIHPTNELLCSDIIPRWAVIGWLLTTCTSPVAASNAKLALFYDWLFFEPEKDNIMNIEPAILVMHHSIKPHPAITATLLDFLCRIITNFFPKEQEKVRNGIYSSLRQILEKRVLPTLSPLFDNPKLDVELKLLLRERFAPFVNGGDNKQPAERHLEAVIDDPVDGNAYMETLDDLSGCAAEFSDDDVEVVKTNEAQDNKKVKKKHANNSGKEAKKETARPSPVKVRKRPQKQSPVNNDVHDLTNAASSTDTNLGENVRELLQDLRSATTSKGEDNMVLLRSDEEEKCETMDRLIQIIISEDFSFEQCNALARKLSDILRASFEGKIFPAASNDEEALEDSVGKPIFVAFRALCDMADGDGSGILLQVLAELYALQPRIGYYLLYFLSVDKQAKQREARTKAAIYKDLCETIDSNYCLDICLVNDMRQCQEDDVELFVHLVTEVYSIFPKTAVGNVNLLYLVVSCVDGRHIQQLVCHILAKDLLLFKKDTFSSIVTGSLSWETFEQCALWQLISAHDVPIDCMYSILPKLSFEKHAEALTATLLRLRTEKPNADLVRHILSREPVKGDRFVCTCFNHWLFEHEDKLAELVSSYLMKQLSASSSSGSSSNSSSSLKRKRGATASSSTGSMSRKAEMTLTHLDHLRQNCRQYEFFSHPSLQKALRASRQSCSDEQKKKFMDLFALAETESDAEDDDEEVQFSFKSSTNNRKSSKSRSSANSRGGRKATPPVTAEEESGESSESENSDDEDTKPLSSSRSKHRGGNSSSSSSKNHKSGGANSRKRPPQKNSSSCKTGVNDSSENSSDDEASSTTAKKKKRRKKTNPSDSD